MATFVLVHGGGHGGWCYRRITPLLRAAGHEVHVPTLTGLGERRHLLRPDVDLQTHVRDVVHLLEYEDLEQVVLVGHSDGHGDSLAMSSDEKRARQLDAEPLFEIDAGHDLMLTEPRRVADMLLQVVR